MDGDLDIVFLGGLYPKGKMTEIYNDSKSAVAVADDVLQWKIVEGFDKTNNTPVKIISSLYIGRYPRSYKKLIIKTYKFNHTAGADDISVGFLNFKYLTNFKHLTILKHLKKWALNGKKNKVVVVYSLVSHVAHCLKYIKKFNPNIKTCVIVSDLIYLNPQTQKRVNKNIANHMKYIDCGVLLTKQMNDLIKLNKYVVMEGIAQSYYDDIISNHTENCLITIAYIGSINIISGIENLVNAFMKLTNPNYRLFIAGYCVKSVLDYILKAMKIDNRIFYKGPITPGEARLI